MKRVKQRILLTGGAGFIGSHVAEALLAQGIELSIVDNFDSYYSSALKQNNLREVQGAGVFKLFRVDINNFQGLREAFNEARPDVVIHFAARPGVRQSIDNPKLYEHINVAGTIALLELSREFGVCKFIFASSSSVYGLAARLPFSEDETRLLPASPYAVTKLAGEMWASTYARLYDIQVICLRLFSVYGPRQRPDLAIFKFVSAIENGRSLPVFGDGSSSRDYTFVDDIALGVIGALGLDVSRTGSKCELFNLGSSRATSLRQLIKIIEIETGRTARMEKKGAQAGDLPFTCANVEKARRLLGYEPKTTLEKGIARFVSWYREHRESGALSECPNRLAH